MRETDSLNDFFSNIETKIKLIEEVNSLYGKEIAPNFNSFNFWYLDENKVSKIIAFFLDPKEDHNHGNIYLKKFLEIFNLSFFNYDEDDDIHVQCEVKTNKGRFIDIVISRNDYEQAIAIENKIHIHTVDQKNQIKDYAEFLKFKTDESYCLMYLCPNDKLLSSDSISKADREYLINEDKLRLLNYENHMINCIHEFSILSENIRVRSFLNDFEKTLRKMYMGINNINNQQAISDFIEEKESNLKHSFLVANSLIKVKENLKSKFEKQIQEVGHELQLEVKELSLTPNNWKHHKISLRYEQGGIIYGISRNIADEIKPEFPRKDELEEELGISYQVSAWWAIYQHLYRNIENNEHFWIDIKNSKAKERIIDFTKLIIDKYNMEKY